jgi:hypothetical protein
VAAVTAGAVLIGAAVTPAVAGLVDSSPTHGSPSSPGSAAAYRIPSVSTSRSVIASAKAGDTAPLTKSIAAVHREAQLAALARAKARHRHKHHATVTVVYDNPLRDISGLIPERVDMGVDFGGAGPIYAIGDGVVTQATNANGGWPGGGWITYELTDGPAAGEVVYVAEDVTPTVAVGDHVTPSTVIANMFNGGDGIETGWAMLDSASSESELPEAGGITGGGPFPTAIGMNFEFLLRALGVPEANNFGQATSGIVPSRYPIDWASALTAKS